MEGNRLKIVNKYILNFYKLIGKENLIILKIKNKF